MDLLIRKIKAFQDLGATEEYITEVLSLVTHERRTAGMEFKQLLETNLKESQEFKAFKVMDETALAKVLNVAKKQWLDK